MKNLRKRQSKRALIAAVFFPALIAPAALAQPIPEPSESSNIKIIRVEDALQTSPSPTVIPVQPIPDAAAEANPPSGLSVTQTDSGATVIEVQDNPPPEPPVYNSIELLGLNKVTARSSTFDGALGTVLRFMNLEIIAHRCIGNLPGQQQDYKALLEIWELKPNEGPEKIFQGWMFSSSPAISALEHPVYDITVKSCQTADLEE